MHRRKSHGRLGRLGTGSTEAILLTLAISASSGLVSGISGGLRLMTIAIKLDDLVVRGDSKLVIPARMTMTNEVVNNLVTYIPRYNQSYSLEL